MDEEARYRESSLDEASGQMARDGFNEETFKKFGKSLDFTVGTGSVPGRHCDAGVADRSVRGLYPHGEDCTLT